MKVFLDMVRKDRGLATFERGNVSGGVIQDGSRWLAEEGEAGMTIGGDKDYRTAEEAVQAIADHYGVTERLEIVRDEEWKDNAD